MKRERFDIVCTECGKTFDVPRCRIETAKFCSNKCHGLTLARTRKGVPLSVEHRTAISEGRIGLVFTPEHRDNIALSRLGTTATKETRAKLRALHGEQAKDPAWRKQISEQTKKVWKDPAARAAIIAGQQAHFATTEYGSNFPVGTPQSELDYAHILLSAGYVAGYVIPTHRPENNGGGYYKLDYAHIQAKIDIEIDGSSHEGKQESDARRDTFLRGLGWKIIRIKV